MLHKSGGNLRPDSRTSITMLCGIGHMHYSNRVDTLSVFSYNCFWTFSIVSLELNTVRTQKSDSGWCRTIDAGKAALLGARPKFNCSSCLAPSSAPHGRCNSAEIPPHLQESVKFFSLMNDPIKRGNRHSFHVSW